MIKKNALIDLVLGTVFMLSPFFGCSCSSSNEGGGDEPGYDYTVKDVEKRSDITVYVHYMPWFESKEVSGSWGMHWTMANRNPDNVDSNGKRQIASHFYPLIGPYDSSDAKVLDYHALLMKYSGIEGVMVDWYGSRSDVKATKALLGAMERVKLKLAIVYEDRNNLDGANSLAQMIQWGGDDMKYLETNFFSSSSYVTIDGKPLLMCFGPIALNKDDYPRSPANWSEIFASLKTKPCFMPLYGHSGNAADDNYKNVGGEFTWVNTLNSNFYDELKQKYTHYIASAYPGFKDFYAEGGWGNSITSVDYRNGQEFQSQLDVVESKKCPMVQLVTWNDFGEGTQIEPTQEDQYKYLEKVQKLTKVKYNSDVLAQIYRHYTLRVKYKNDKAATAKLEEAFKAFASLQPDRAIELMQGLQ